MPKVAIYIRASTKAQDDKDSFKQQLDLCEHLADKKEYEVFKVYKDVKSGAKKRDGFFDMIADANYFDVVIAYSQDRLYRGTLDTGYQEFARLVDKDVFGVELVTENFDKNYMELFASIGGIESRTRAKRIKRGVIAKLKRGEHWNIQNKYGYSQDEDKNAVVNTFEMEVIKQIYDWYLEGVGVRKIAEKLTVKGAPKKKLKKKGIWRFATIYKLLHDETYSTGIHKTKRDGKTYQAEVPKIIDQKIYAQVQAKLEKGNNRHRGHNNKKHNYLLTGKITCPCGTGWNARTRNRIKRHKKVNGEVSEYKGLYSYYRCNKTTNQNERHPNCPGTKGVVELDALIWDKVSAILENPDLVTRAAEKRIAEIDELNKNAQDKKRKLKETLKGIVVQRNTYTELFGRSSVNGGHYNEDDLNRDLSRLGNEEHQACLELAELEIASNPDNKKMSEIIKSQLKTAAGFLNKESNAGKLQFDKRKLITQALIKKVYLERGKEPKIELSLNLAEMGAISSSRSISQQSRDRSPR